MAKKRRSSAWSITRDSVRPQLKAVSDYALHTGQVMWAWNDLQKSYLELFMNVMSPPGGQRVALAAWHTLVSDQAQRDMLEASLGEAWRGKGSVQRGLKNMKWALKETRNLTAYRNIAAHMPIEIPLGDSEPRTIPDKFFARRTAETIINELGHKFVFRTLILELHVLACYVGGHVSLFFEVSPGEFPRKPRLRLHRLCQEAVRRAGPPKGLELKPRQRAMLTVDRERYGNRE